MLTALKYNSFKERKLRHARVFYSSKIMFASFKALKQKMEVNGFKNHLNTRMMHFLKNKCISMFKVAFTQWRTKFEHKQFKG